MKNPITKTWRKMKSLGHMSSSNTGSVTRSKSWNGLVNIEDANYSDESKGKIKKESPPQHGFFTVYVGPTKQRVVVKTKLVNHPLFKNLLEESENEYGYIRDGPIVLPCEVDFFFKALADMKKSNDHAHDDGFGDDYDEDDGMIDPPICGMFSPLGGTDSMAMRRISSYKLLRSPSLFKLNRF